MPEALRIAGTEVPPGSRATVQIPVARRYTANEVWLPVRVVHGRTPGPRLFVSAAIHGDEINGTEIIRRLLRMPLLRRIHGALIAVPVVNVYGFVSQSRYLPDRRDLNRSFPGSPRGSLAARLADQFMTEVVQHATHGIDLHTGSLHRSNLPQVRAHLEDPETARLAHAFGTPVILDAGLRDGSLREAVHARDMPIVVYEGGEALRFDELAIQTGVRGVIGAMRELGMLPPRRARKDGQRRHIEPFVARGSTWVRAPASGILNTSVRLGARVAKEEVLGFISDPLGDTGLPVPAPADGVVIGRINLPLVNEGDALFHVGVFKRLDSVVEQVEALHADVEPEPGAFRDPEPT
jgi:predicted deacylase